MMAGFVVGAMVGAGVALLLAPASGRETRERLKEKARELRGKAGQLKDNARGALEHASESVRAGAREFGHAVKEGRDAYQRATEDSAAKRA
jgi:gas vesicle protein